MEQEEVTSYLDWVNSSVMNDIETDFAATFYASEKRSALEVCRFYEGKAGLDDEYKIPNINIDPEPVSTVLDVDLFSVCYFALFPTHYHRPADYSRNLGIPVTSSV